MFYDVVGATLLEPWCLFKNLLLPFIYLRKSSVFYVFSLYLSVTWLVVSRGACFGFHFFSAQNVFWSIFPSSPESQLSEALLG